VGYNPSDLHGIRSGLIHINHWGELTHNHEPWVVRHQAGLSRPIQVIFSLGDDPFVGLERFDPVIKNAWQKHVRSADQLPQENLALEFGVLLKHL
jgi:hypothetical protein